EEDLLATGDVEAADPTLALGEIHRAHPLGVAHQLEEEVLRERALVPTRHGPILTQPGVQREFSETAPRRGPGPPVFKKKLLPPTEGCSPGCVHRVHSRPKTIEGCPGVRTAASCQNVRKRAGLRRGRGG